MKNIICPRIWNWEFLTVDWVKRYFCHWKLGPYTSIWHQILANQSPDYTCATYLSIRRIFWAQKHTFQLFDNKKIKTLLWNDFGHMLLCCKHSRQVSFTQGNVCACVQKMFSNSEHLLPTLYRLNTQCRSRLDCFFRSSLIRVFPVCYSDKHFVNSSPDSYIWLEKKTSVKILKHLPDRPLVKNV